MKDYYGKTVEQTAGELGTGADGLTAAEAAKRLVAGGENKLKESKKTPLIKRILKQLADPMIIILIAAAVVSLVISILDGGEGIAEVIIIAAVVVLNAVLGVAQESKADNAIEALREMTAATSKVVRDGKQQVVKSSELVVGDLVVLEAGDSVPADMRVTMSASLKISEAPLTGESLPAEKRTDPIKGDNVPLGDRENMAYSGCTVVYGRGRGVITSTGMDTEMGKIAGALVDAKEEKTPLQRKLGQLSRLLTFVVLGVCAIVFAVRLLTAAGGVNVHVVLDSFIIAVSLAVAAIPEGLATVVTLTLSIGVTRMSKRSAVIRRQSAVETLGCAQIICSDKTGTLTQNRMTVVAHYADDETLLARALALCSDAYPETCGAVGEPTECALVDYATSLGLDKREIEKTMPRVKEVPFDSERKMMTTMHADGGKVVRYTKGAPDEVIKVCDRAYVGGKIVPLTEELRAAALAENKRMANKTLRVLAAAFGEGETDTTAAAAERGLVFIGLVGMIDPVRPEVKQAVEECREAGIRPIMITGDHLDTATAIALDLGIITDGSQAITGAMLDEISDAEFAEGVKKYSVYARVRPENKTRIVNAWKALGCVTAMTGDGVNDAPSIKAADIGIGMGITGTDVTKSAADMVLADDNFATIVTAVGEGRRIYDNIRKAIAFLLSSNLAEVIAIFFATMLGFTILQPAHLLWINLIGDTVPAIALGMEKSEPDVMKRPPRSSKAGVFADGMGADILTQGVFLSVITVLGYFIGCGMESAAAGNGLVWGIPDGGSTAGVTTAFLTLALAKMFHIFNARSRTHSIFTMKKQNVWIWAAFGGSLVLTTAVVYIPFLSAAFGFTAVSAGMYFVAMALAFSVIPFVEISKLIRRARTRRLAVK